MSKCLLACPHIQFTFHIQPPVERKLGSKIVAVSKKGRRKFERVSDYVYEVPLLSSLQQLLSSPMILEEVVVELGYSCFICIDELSCCKCRC